MKEFGQIVNTSKNGGSIFFTFENGKLHCETEPAIKVNYETTEYNEDNIWYLYGKPIIEWRDLLPHLNIPSNRFADWPIEDQIAFRLAAGNN